MRLCNTGGMAKGAITEGQVKVDGKVELRKGAKIRPGQIVEFEGKENYCSMIIRRLTAKRVVFRGR